MHIICIPYTWYNTMPDNDAGFWFLLSVSQLVRFGVCVCLCISFLSLSLSNSLLSRDNEMLLLLLLLL